MAALSALNTQSSISGRTLAKAIKVVLPLATNQTPDVQLSADGAATWLACGNGDTAARIRVPIQCDSGIASAKNLHRALYACGADEVFLECGKEGGLVKTDRFTCSVRPAKGEILFRQLPLDEKSEPVTLSFTGRDFWAIYNACRGAASNDLYRPILCGIALQNHEGKLLAVSTDTHRLHVLETGIDPGEFALSIVVPGPAWDAVARFDPGLDAEFDLTVIDGKLFEISTDGFSVGGDLIAGTYPNWPRVMPTEHLYELSFDTGDLVRALRSLSSFAKEAAQRVFFIPDDGGLNLTVKHEQFGVIEHGVPVVANAPFDRFAFNCRYLLEAISAVGGKRITIRGKAYNARMLIVGEDERIRVVVAPMAVA